ncbi:unnamed protein product, partial [Ectocarpus sp. 4 AP-2014]
MLIEERDARQEARALRPFDREAGRRWGDRLHYPLQPSFFIHRKSSGYSRRNCIQRNHRILISTDRSKERLNCTPDAIPCCPWMCCNKQTTHPRRLVGTYDMMM